MPNQRQAIHQVSAAASHVGPRDGRVAVPVERLRDSAPRAVAPAAGSFSDQSGALSWSGSCLRGGSR